MQEEQQNVVSTNANTFQLFSLSSLSHLKLSNTIIRGGSRPVARLDFRGCGIPENGPFGPKPPHKPPFLTQFVSKNGLFGPNPLIKPHFQPVLQQKVDLFTDLGWCVLPPVPPGYGPGWFPLESNPGHLTCHHPYQATPLTLPEQQLKSIGPVSKTYSDLDKFLHFLTFVFCEIQWGQG